MTTDQPLLEALPVAVYTVDVDGRITGYNDAAVALWGRKPEPGDRWCVCRRILRADGYELPFDETPVAIAVRERRPVCGAELTMERHDGALVRYNPMPTPLFDASGRLTGAVNVVVEAAEPHHFEEGAMRLAAIVSSSDDAIISMTLDGAITSWNAGAERIFGYTAEEIIGRHITTLIPLELRHEGDEIIAKLTRGEPIKPYETVRLTKEGRRIDTSVTISPIRDAQGRVTGASKVARDISERKRSEVDLARLAAIVSSSDDAIISKTLDGKITSWNAGAQRIFGYTAEEMIGKHITTLIPPELYGEEEEIIARLSRGERIEHFETTRVSKDGRRHDISLTISPMRDSSGKIIGASKIARDITERRKHEIDLSRLAAIVSSSDDAIVSKTLQGFVTSWNIGAERIFGYRSEEMLGRHITTLIPPELHEEEERIIAQLACGERIEHYETVRIAKDGRRVDISLTVSPIRDSSGQVVGASKVARDVTDRKRAEETQRLLLDELNHRIKNTLATVQAIATQTLRRAKDPSSFVTAFNGRIQSLSRAHALLTGGSFQGADIQQLVRDQLLLGGQPDPRIAWAGPSVLLEGQVALHLALVLHELGTNARKHGALSAPSGQVSARWEVRSNAGPRLVFDWRESGGPKVKAPASRGFGSLLIEQSLQTHGGIVSVSYVETGLVCTIDLPLPHIERPLGMLTRETAHISIAPAAQRQSLAGKRVLIIEDEPLIGMVLTDYLTDAGCIPVGPAQNLERALALIREETFDAALVDGNLAGRSVDEIAVMLTQRRTPFAFVTGYGREALPIGFQEALIVEKPFTQDQVTGALERLLAPGDNVSPLRSPRHAG
jgi:PAS domain S-box-containing protein